jgi:hypothetical protein
LSVWAMRANVEWITVGFTPDLETNWPVVGRPGFRLYACVPGTFFFPSLFRFFRVFFFRPYFFNFQQKGGHRHEEIPRVIHSMLTQNRKCVWQSYVHSICASDANCTEVADRGWTICTGCDRMQQRRSREKIYPRSWSFFMAKKIKRQYKSKNEILNECFQTIKSQTNMPKLTVTQITCCVTVDPKPMMNNYWFPT